MRRIVKRATFLVILAVGMLFVPGGHAVRAVQDDASDFRPNLIFMMTDDQRWDVLSLAGNTIIETPNMDRIGREGAWMRNMFVTHSLCAPSRASFLTGLYSHTHGVIDNRGRQIPLDIPLVSDILHEHGYEVALCGKWHMRGAGRERYWDYYFGYNGQGRYLNPVTIDYETGEETVHEGRWMDDVVTDAAIEFIRRDHDRPYCLFLWFKAPHRSWVRPPRLEDRYADVTVPEPPTFDTDYEGKPEAFRDADMHIGDFNDVPDFQTFIENYYAVVEGVDQNVGRVFEALEETGQLDDTAMFFSGDNGFFLGDWHYFDKRFMHEVSIRVPMLVRYPPLIEPGTERSEMILNIDLAPTLLELAGVEAPEHMHGRSFLPLLRGEDVPWRDAWLYEYYEYPRPHRVRPNRGVRTDRWKYIYYYAIEHEGRRLPDEYELYDLESDPWELENLYGRPEYEEVVEELRARMEELRRETGDPEVAGT